jgi:hypothetical protein
MANRNQFVIHNDLTKSLTLNIEPEGALFSLGKGAQVTVFDEFTHAPVTLKLTASDKGDPILSIWPGDGDVRVEKDGADLLDLLQNGVGV